MSIKLLAFMVVALSIFFWATYAIFFYWSIDDNNKWSTFFSFTSTFGIIFTIIIYILQKNDNDAREKNEINKKSTALHLLITDTITNFTISLNSAIVEFHHGTTEEGLRHIDDIDTNIIASCLYDASKVNVVMFNYIAELNFALRQYKKAIKNDIGKNNNTSTELARVRCQQAIDEINEICNAITSHRC
ncbi:hypothetical protein [Providencia rettgeri]|uniref:hypothetical protein n=1 Tax=Providencia rettgeri TaxID=587 RepID=UPI00384E4452